MIVHARSPRTLARTLMLSIRMLAANRLRTALSVSGLLVGVAAVTVMVSVAEGARRRVVERVAALGTDLLIVSAAPAPRVATRERQVATVTTLRTTDARAITDESALAVAAAPSVTRPLVVRTDGRNSLTTIIGTTPTGLGIRNVRARRGRLFDESEDRERRRVAVLGPTVVRKLWGDAEADVVGREIRIGRVPFDVVGVLLPSGTDPGGTDLDDIVWIPLETAMRRVLNVPYVDALLVQARRADDLDALEAEVRDVLGRRHPARTGTTQPFVVQNQAVLLRTQREASLVLTRLTAVVGGLGLTIGAVGIVTVLLVSVKQRSREIGLRRAVGARQADIQLQFLLESAVLAAAGGGAGAVVGALASLAASMVGPWELAVSWRAAGLGVVCSTVVGLVVGTIPAARAARLEPSEALRGA